VGRSVENIESQNTHPCRKMRDKGGGNLLVFYFRDFTFL